MSTGFGARPDGGAFHSRQEQDIQALKLRLHRYIIDEIDEDGMNLLEGARSAVVQYVSEKVCEYGSRHQLAISATNWTAWPKRWSTNSPASARWRSSCAIPASRKSSSTGRAGCSSSGKGGSTRATCASSTTTMCCG